MRGNAEPAACRSAPADDWNLDAVLLQQRGLQRVKARDDCAGLAGVFFLQRSRQRKCGHRAEHRLRARRLDSDAFAQQPASGDCEVVVVLHQRRPTAGEEAFAKSDCSGHREPCGDIERALPVELIVKQRAALAWRVVAVADHCGMHARLPVAPDEDEARTAWRADPLVKVARVK